MLQQDFNSIRQGRTNSPVAADPTEAANNRGVSEIYAAGIRRYFRELKRCASSAFG
jgi:hypothetical protein